MNKFLSFYKTNLQRVTLLLLVFALLSCNQIATAQNLVINSGLENWDSDIAPTGWTKIQGISKETVNLHSGSFAAKQNAGSSTQSLGQYVPVEAGKKYRISYWFLDNTPNARARVYSTWRDANDAEVKLNKVEIQPTAYSTNNPDWIQFNVTVTAPVGAVNLLLDVRTYGEGDKTGAIYFDDFVVETVNEYNPADASLSELTVDKGMLNPDFEAATYAYTVSLPAGSTQTPIVAATSTNPKSTIKINSAKDITSPELLDKRTTVFVTAEDGISTNNYSVDFIVQPSLAGTVVINEVGEPYNMPNTYRDSYIELYNPTDETKDISGWTIWSKSTGTGTTSSFTFPAGSLIAAKGYFIATRDRAKFLADYGTYLSEAIVPIAQAIVKDAVYIADNYYFELVDATGNTIDKTSSLVKWNSKVWERTSATDDPLLAATWHESYKFVPQQGTPGASNTTEPIVAEYTINKLQSQIHSGETTKTKGVVTAVFGSLFTMQDGTGEYSGIWVEGTGVVIGDSITVEGVVKESYNVTTITSKTIVKLNSGNALPAPSVITTTQAKTEPYEGVRIQVTGACDILNPDAPDDFNEWSVNDGSGSVRIDDMGYKFEPELNLTYKITGVLYFSFSNFKVEPSTQDDVVLMSKPVSNDALLSSLSVSLGSLAPEFETATFNYTVELPIGSTQTPTTTATPRDAKAKVVVVDATNVVSLLVADRTTTVDVTAEDGTTTAQYKVVFNVAVAPSSDASLKKITLSAGKVSPDFVPETLTYTADLPFSTTVAPTITVETTHAKATVEVVNATNVVSDVQADRTATITVTAEDKTIHIYTIVYNILPAPGADLFFSEYIEGSANNKALEIYNPTGQAVDLSQYTVKQARNGVNWDTDGAAYIEVLSGTLAAKEVFVIYNTAADAPKILAEGDLSLSFDSNRKLAAFNGDDAIGLFKNGELIDIIGVPTVDPGDGWAVAGIAVATKDHTIIRKAEIGKGNTDWAASAGTDINNSEWVVLANNSYDNLGKHGAEQPKPKPTLVINEYATDVTDNAGAETSSWIELYNYGAQPLNIAGMYLTNDLQNPVLFKISDNDPALTTINASGYLQIYTDGATTQGILHTSFILSKAGGKIGLYDTDGKGVIDTLAYTPQTKNVSNGRYPDGSGAWKTFDVTTPGAKNVVMPQKVAIYNIQHTTNATGNSDLANKIVTTSGIVTAMVGTTGFYMQDSAKVWNGIYVFTQAQTPAVTVQVGDKVTLTASVYEYYNFTELKTITEYTIESSNNPLPEPVVISAKQMTEAVEGVLVKLENYTCINVDFDAHKNSLYVRDGEPNDTLMVHTFIYKELVPILSTKYTFTGIGNYDWSDFKVEPRNADDVIIKTIINNPPVIANVLVTPETPITGQSITVLADITDDIAVVSKKFFYGTSANQMNTEVALTAVGFAGTRFKAIIPAQKQPTTIYYKFVVTDVDFTTNYTGNIDIITNIDTEEQEPMLKLYPNPVSNVLYISHKLDLQKVVISNIIGQSIRTIQPTSNETLRIDLSSLKNGIYLVTCIDKQGNRLSHKIIKQ